jgi:hypothetical protein
MGWSIWGSILAGTRDFSLLISRPNLGTTQLRIQRVPGFFPGVKQLGHEVWRSSPSAAKVQNGWNYTTCFPDVSHAVDWDSFYLASSYDFVFKSNIFTLSVLALPSTKKDEEVLVAHHEQTSSSDFHSLIGISLVLGFVFMLLVDQCSVFRSRGKLIKSVT